MDEEKNIDLIYNVFKKPYSPNLKKNLSNSLNANFDKNFLQQTSVIALFIFTKNQTKLLFIQKADIKGYPWRNQMAFPGGHKDKNDIDTKQTALRELKEELGINKKNVEILSPLINVQTINNTIIKAWVGIWNKKEIIKYDKSEISRVFQIPLSHLIKVHKEKKYHQHDPPFFKLTYPYKDVVIWGATAKILHSLIQRLILFKI